MDPVSEILIFVYCEKLSARTQLYMYIYTCMEK